MTIAFLDGQPPEAHGPIMDLLASGSVQMSVLLEMDFAPEPLRLCNRTIAFEDLKDGKTWAAGHGLLVGLPEIGGGDGTMAPARMYHLGAPWDWITSDTWRADIVSMVRDRAAYVGRQAALYVQFFDPDSNVPVGHPAALDIGFMDRMTASFQRAGTVISVSSEGFLARKGMPVYGMQTYFDQRRRYPDDEGFEFVTEADRLVTWTNW